MAGPDEIRIRPLSQADARDLKRMLQLALFVPPGSSPLPPDVVESPELARYVEDWCRETDLGFAALDDSGRMIGAAWLRLMTGEEHGYGYVDDQTPELSVALEEDYRGTGIGTRLLERLLSAAAERYLAVSLSVTEVNPAVRLYGRLDFVTVRQESGTLTMLKTLTEETK